MHFAIHLIFIPLNQPRKKHQETLRLRWPPPRPPWPLFWRHVSSAIGAIFSRGSRRTLRYDMWSAYNYNLIDEQFKISSKWSNPPKKTKQTNTKQLSFWRCPNPFFSHPSGCWFRCACLDMAAGRWTAAAVRSRYQLILCQRLGNMFGCDMILA